VEEATAEGAVWPAFRPAMWRVYYYEVAPHVPIGAFLYSQDWRLAHLCAQARPNAWLIVGGHKPRLFLASLLGGVHFDGNSLSIKRPIT
jgi:hypothetical protein